MKIRSIPSVFLLIPLFAVLAAADGIYVTEDLKHVRGKHTTIILNESQILDVEQRREIVLTEAQLEPLRAIYKKTPNKLIVVSSRWDSCTCGMGIYAIWCRVGELDVPHSSLEGAKSMDEYYENNPVAEPEDGDPILTDEIDSSGFRENERYIFAGRSLILDSKSDMHFEGERVTESELRSLIDKISKVEGKGKRVRRYISFDVPPPIGPEIDEKVLGLIKSTRTYCEQKNVNFYAMGFR